MVYGGGEGFNYMHVHYWGGKKRDSKIMETKIHLMEDGLTA